MVLVSGGVFSLLILQLGGSKFEIGLAYMISFLAQTARVFVARYADVHDTKRMFVRWSHVANVMFLLMFLIEPIRVAAGSRAAVWFACGVLFLQRISVNIGGTAWNPLIAHTIPAALRGRFLGSMRRTYQVASLLVIIAAGYFLGNEPTIMRFYLVFAALLASSVVRPFLMSTLPDVDVKKGARPERFARNIVRPFKDAHFRHFLMFWGFLVFSINIARPFTVPYLKQDLGFPSSATIYASSLLVLGMAISLVRWGRLVDRLGNRLVFLLNNVLLAFAFVALACTPRFEDASILALIVAAVSILMIGIAIGGQGIAHTVRTMRAAPAQYRGSYMAAFFVVNGIIAGVSSTLSGLLLDALPAMVVFGAKEIVFMRFYFPVASLLILTSIPFLRRMSLVSERSFEKSIPIFIESLPSVISVPLQAVRAFSNNVPSENGDED